MSILDSDQGFNDSRHYKPKSFFANNRSLTRAIIWGRQKKQKFYDSIKIPEKYIISVKNKCKDVWDIFILLLALQNSILIPLDFSFKPAFVEFSFYKVFDLMVDLCFLIDMILMCLTSYRDRKGVEIFDSR